MDAVEEIIQEIAPGYPDGDPQAIRAGATAWRQVAGGLSQAFARLDTEGKSAGSGWDGADYDAFYAEFKSIHSGVTEFASSVEEFSVQLDELANGLEEAQREYKAAMIEVGVTVAIGVGLSFVSFGASNAVAGAAVAARLSGIAVRVLGVSARVAAIMQRLAVLFTGLLRTFTAGFAVNTLSQGIANEIVFPERDFMDSYSVGEALAAGVSYGVFDKSSLVLNKINLGSTVTNSFLRAGGTSVVAGGTDAATQLALEGKVDFNRVLFSATIGGGTYLGGTSVSALSQKLRGVQLSPNATLFANSALKSKVVDAPASGVNAYSHPPVKRGFILEKYIRRALGDRQGVALPVNHKLIDDWYPQTGTASQIKTIDPRSKTYIDPKKFESKINGYAKKHAEFKGVQTNHVSVIPHRVQIRELAIGMPSSGLTPKHVTALERVASKYPNLDLRVVFLD